MNKFVAFSALVVLGLVGSAIGQAKVSEKSIIYL